MMITKKHFEAAAEIVRYEASRTEAAIMARGFVELFRKFNPRFDEERFLAACEPRQGGD